MTLFFEVLELKDKYEYVTYTLYSSIMRRYVVPVETYYESTRYSNKKVAPSRFDTDPIKDMYFLVLNCFDE